jgi:hypothetical protein
LEKLSQDDIQNVRVLFVSYADSRNDLQRLWIQEWIKNYCGSSSSNATLVLDPTKSAYQAWSIPSSLAAGWGLANIWYYAKAIITCRTRTVQVKGEAGQLGADFVVAPDGTILLEHYCKNPTDRVKVEKIAEVLRSFQKAS